MQVRSLAWQSGLKIWRCCSCGLGENSGLDLTPGLGIPCALGWPGKKKKALISKELVSCRCVGPISTVLLEEVFSFSFSSLLSLVVCLFFLSPGY